MYWVRSHVPWWRQENPHGPLICESTRAYFELNKILPSGYPFIGSRPRMVKKFHHWCGKACFFWSVCCWSISKNEETNYTVTRKGTKIEKRMLMSIIWYTLRTTSKQYKNTWLDRRHGNDKIDLRRLQSTRRQHAGVSLHIILHLSFDFASGRLEDEAYLALFLGTYKMVTGRKFCRLLTSHKINHREQSVNSLPELDASTFSVTDLSSASFHGSSFQMV